MTITMIVTELPNSEDLSSSSEDSDLSDPDDSSDAGQGTTEEPDNDMTTSEEETNPLLETITNKVTNELASKLG